MATPRWPAGESEQTALAQEKETGRVEAFSDGVFAIAITLLILELKVPKGPPGTLLANLVAQWPTYLSYLTSFVTILVMWVNHHQMFNLIRRTNVAFLFLNGLLLLFITVVPFPTALVSDHLLGPDSKTAAAVFGGTYFGIAIAFNAVWRYASGGLRLIDPRVDVRSVEAITRAYRVGPAAYFTTFILAFVWVPASLGLNLALAVFFAVTASIRNPTPLP
ncbi:MAG TPA: TMEM175 family protein [Thermoanaerobaculia bacterium]|nr:TMEM175 family protein [Thermoanaerobaculia bacterium]